MRGRMIMCALTAAVLAVANCGGSDDGDGAAESTAAEDLVAVMVDSGAPREEAECVADKLGDVSAGQLEEFFEAVADGEDVVATEGIARQFLNARVECTVEE